MARLDHLCQRLACRTRKPRTSNCAHLLNAPGSWHDSNVKTFTFPVVLLGLSFSCFAADCPKNQAKNDATLIGLEQTWAAALNRKDVAAVACLLADEFEDADVDGSLHSRKETLDHIPNKKPGTNQLSEMRAYVEGNMGYTRGLATLVDGSGNVKARVRFTDVYTYRDGRWQALAGQESLLGAASR